MNESARFDRAWTRVVRTQNCSGCGACTRLDPGLSMAVDADGYSRPVRTGPAGARTDATRIFNEICPGRRVVSPRPSGATVHPTLGAIVSSWQAWAGDPAVRHRGSSGGALTALAGWLLDIGEVAACTAVRADPASPRRTVPVTITTRAESLESAGSRYAPVATMSAPDALRSDHALVAKPCEISAARQLGNRAGSEDRQPLLLSFFCAGTPSQHATENLLVELGLPGGSEVSDLWYRGRGWPGRFTARTPNGGEVSASYDESWGRYLGPFTQWRCKICPDGVGESGDISAADFWRTDARGYPDFTEGDGCSAVLARTARGHEVLTRAFAAGVLIGRPLDPDDLAAVQPLQVARRTTLLGRLTGTVLARRPVPRYRGFGLIRLAVGSARETARTAKGSYWRVRRQAKRRD